METALSVIDPNCMNFDVQNDGEDEEEEFDAEQREKELQEVLDQEFNDLDDEEDEEEEDDDENQSISKNFSREFKDDLDNRSQVSFSRDRLDDFTSTSPKTQDEHILHERNNYPVQYQGTGDQSTNGTAEEHHPDAFGQRMVNGGGDACNGRKPVFRHDFGDQNNYVQYQSNGLQNGCGTNYSYGPSQSSAEFSGAPSTTVLQEEYRQLQILYQARGQELEELKHEQIKGKSDAEREIKVLAHKLTLLQGKSNDLGSNLHQSQQLLTDKIHENNVLQGELSALRLKFSAENKAKDEILAELQNKEFTIKSLEQQISSSARSENVSRLREQHDRFVEELKLRHQKDALRLKEDVDAMHQKLCSKEVEISNAECKIERLEQKLEQLQVEKVETFNKLTMNLEASQRQCQQLLESGTISEVSVLKMQKEHFEELGMRLEKENATLKNEVKALEFELKNHDAVQNHLLLSKNPAKEIKASEPNSDLHKELGHALKNLRSQRSHNSSLKDNLDSIINRFNNLQEEYKLLEARAEKAEERAKELESQNEKQHFEQLEHEAIVKDLENKIVDLQKNFQVTSDHLREVSKNEETLSNLNRKLQRAIAVMKKQHEGEKQMAVEQSTERCLRSFEETIKKLNDQQNAKAEAELKRIQALYDNKIQELHKEVQHLNNELYDTKDLYVKACEENQLIQSKQSNLERSALKNRAQLIEELKPQLEGELRLLIEKEIALKVEKEKQLEFEKKMCDHLEKMKERLEKEKDEELTKKQEEWTKQKISEVKDFKSKTKQEMEENFGVCLANERKNLEEQFLAEKTNLCLEYENQIKSLEQAFSKEKENLEARPKESFTSQIKEMIKQVELKYKSELEHVTKTHDIQISVLQKELEESKRKTLEYEREKDDVMQEMIEKEKFLTEKETASAGVEKKLRHEVKKYQKYSSNLKKQHKEETNEMMSQLSQLQKERDEEEKSVKQLLAEYRKEISTMKEIINRKEKIPKSHSGCQTEEEVLTKAEVSEIQDNFLSCMRSIQDAIQTYVKEGKKKRIEYLQEALMHYHSKMMSKFFPNDSTPPDHIPSTHSTNAKRTSHVDHSTKPKTINPSHRHRTESCNQLNLKNIGALFDDSLLDVMTVPNPPVPPSAEVIINKCLMGQKNQLRGSMIEALSNCVSLRGGKT